MYSFVYSSLSLLTLPCYDLNTQKETYIDQQNSGYPLRIT